MTINLDTLAIDTASNPEEAALIFKATVTKGLAALMAEALDNALDTKAFDANPALAGWQTFVDGMHVDLAWAKPAIAGARSLTQTTAFAPMSHVAERSDTASITLGWEVGVSVKGTF